MPRYPFLASQNSDAKTYNTATDLKNEKNKFLLGEGHDSTPVSRKDKEQVQVIISLPTLENLLIFVA